MDRAKKSKVHTLTMPRSTMERSGMAGSNTYARRGQGKGLVLTCLTGNVPTNDGDCRLFNV